MKKEIDLSIVIPCYNEESILEQSVAEITAVMDQTKYSYELIFVDDGSQDRTRDLILKIVSSYRNKNIYYLFHKKNLGRGGTVIDGIEMSKGKYVGFLDIDLEVHARYIPSMILALERGYDIATGYRVYFVIQTGILRHILSKGYKTLVRSLLKINLKDTETGYKFFDRKRIMPIIGRLKHKGWFWDTEIMAISYFENLKIIEIPVVFIHRMEKKSTVHIFRDSLNYFRSLIKFRKQLLERFKV